MNKMLSTSPVMRFPSTPDSINIGTSSILSKYNLWYETLSQRPFERKTDFFQLMKETPNAAQGSPLFDAK